MKRVNLASQKSSSIVRRREVFYFRTVVFLEKGFAFFGLILCTNSSIFIYRGKFSHTRYMERANSAFLESSSTLMWWAFISVDIDSVVSRITAI